MLIAVCTLFSCGGDDPVNIDPDDKVDPEQPETPDKPTAKKKKIKKLLVHYGGSELAVCTVSYDKEDRICNIEYRENEYQHIDITKTYNKNKVTILTKDLDDGSIIDHIEGIRNDKGFISKTTSLETSGYPRNASMLYNKDGYICELQCSSHNTVIKHTYINNELTSYNVKFNDENYYEDNMFITYTQYENKLRISSALLTERFRFIDEYVYHYGFMFEYFFSFYEGLFGNPSKYLEEGIWRDNHYVSFDYTFDKDGYPIKIAATESDIFTAVIEYYNE